MDENRQHEELTHDNLPKVVNCLINEVAELREVLLHIDKQLGLGVDKRRPIGIDDVCRILDKNKQSVQRLINKGLVPHYKQDGNVYFFEHEILS